jgi:hypothetical protein
VATAHLHHDEEMAIMHEFEVGGRVGGPEIPLHITVRFGVDGRISSLMIQPRDQELSIRPWIRTSILGFATRRHRRPSLAVAL